jgi:hypothetical protein
MTKVYVFNSRTQVIKATLNIDCFIDGSSTRTAYIKRLHDKKYWLKCGCCTPSAVMYPRLQNHTYQLVNDPVKGKHYEGCGLYTPVSGERNFLPGVPSVNTTAPNSFTPIKVGHFTRNPQSKKKFSPCAGNGVRIKKADSIHTLLSFALSQAKLDQMYYGKKYNIKDLFKTSIFKIPVCRGGKGKRDYVSVGDITFFDPDLDEISWKNVVQKRKRLFNKGIPMQAFIVLLVDNVQFDRIKGVVEVNSYGKNLSYRCSRVSHYYEKTPGPRLVFIVNAVINEHWETMAIYTHPIVSPKIPVLVDSHIERKFVFELLSHKDSMLRLKKFYHGVFDNGIFLLPDFKLTNIEKGSHWSELIEVMGINSCSEYTERKSALIPAMSKRYQLPVSTVFGHRIKGDCQSAIKRVKEATKNGHF